MTSRQRPSSARRPGEPENLIVQGLTGIGIVAAASLLIAVAGLVLALAVSWFF